MFTDALTVGQLLDDLAGQDRSAILMVPSLLGDSTSVPVGRVVRGEHRPRAAEEIADVQTPHTRPTPVFLLLPARPMLLPADIYAGPRHLEEATLTSPSWVA